MFWIILAILIVGYYVVKSIRQNTYSNEVIAQQQYLNSTEYRMQAKASMAYWSYINNILDYQIWIEETKLKLINPPAQLWKSKINRKTNKSITIAVKDKSEVLKKLKETLIDYEHWLKVVKKEYENKKSEYTGYYPEDLETIKIKYELYIPFATDADFLNYEGTSSWSIYEDRQAKLKKIKSEIENYKMKKIL